MQSPPTSLDSTLDGTQRRLLIGVCFIAGAVSMVPSTYNFVLTPMLDGLGASETQGALLRQLPSISALLVIFLASSLGARFGERKIILICSVGLTIGCAIVGLAPALPFATLGLVVLSASSSALAVVGLSLLSSGVTGTKARATAFASMTLVAPIVFMLLPIAAGWMIDHSSWRTVPLMWTVGAVIVVWGTWRFIPRDRPERESYELMTPALAGVTLAAAVQSISAANSDGLFSLSVLIRITVAFVSAIALVVTYRRTPQPSISLESLKRGGMLVLLVVVIVIPFVNLWFYMTIEYQYVFGMNVATTALLMAPAQLAGVFGALVARKLIWRFGITFAGVSLLLCLALTLLSSTQIRVDTQIWVTVVLMSAYALASVGAGVAVTNAIMNTAPPGEDGSAASFRGGAIHIGTALGVVVMTAIVWGAGSTSINDTLGSEGLEVEKSLQIAEMLREGSSSEEASSQYSGPVSEVNEINDAQKQAMLAGLHAHGLAGTVFIGAASGVFWLGRRRQLAKE